MRQPRTAIDPRFSEPGTTATTWDQAREVLAQAQLLWIATVRADGRPHVTPLVAVWLDDKLYFTAGPQEQKAVNLRRNPHVVLLTGRDDWDRGLDVVVEGEALPVNDEARLARLADAWRTRWDGRWVYQVRDGDFVHAGGRGPALVFAVAPAKILAFGKGPYSQTRHVF